MYVYVCVLLCVCVCVCDTDQGVLHTLMKGLETGGANDPCRRICLMVCETRLGTEGMIPCKHFKHLHECIYYRALHSTCREGGEEW